MSSNAEVSTTLKQPKEGQAVLAWIKCWGPHHLVSRVSTVPYKLIILVLDISQLIFFPDLVMCSPQGFLTQHLMNMNTKNYNLSLRRSFCLTSYCVYAFNCWHILSEDSQYCALYIHLSYYIYIKCRYLDKSESPGGIFLNTKDRNLWSTI